MLKNLILIGASTGGPGLIESIITSLAEVKHSAIIIAQHMDVKLLASFAKRLNRINPHNDVLLVKDTTEIKENSIYVLEDTSKLITKGAIAIEKVPSQTGFYHPTIDILFSSAKDLNTVSIYAYLLSGIGADGVNGLLDLKHQGHYTVAQDEASSIVYGMPKRAKESNASNSILGIQEIIEDIRLKVS